MRQHNTKKSSNSSSLEVLYVSGNDRVILAAFVDNTTEPLLLGLSGALHTIKNSSRATVPPPRLLAKLPRTVT
jgi:hypothetical protein